MTALCLMLSVLTSCDNAHKGYSKTDEGLYYRFLTTNEGELPNVGDVIDYQWACIVNDVDTLIPASPFLYQLMEPQYPTDLMRGLAMMHKGDSASFIVDADSAALYIFGNQQYIDKYGEKDIMRFEVKMNDFYPESEFVKRMVESVKEQYPEETAKANADLQAYFTENNIVATPTATGLYYVMTSEGNGEMPAKGDIVKVHYTGKLLDGTVFDSSIERGEPIEFPVGAGYVIPGWDEGIMMMSVGEKGVLYIPYYLAYGPNGSAPVIPPFATLIFDVELTGIQKVQ